MRTREEMQEAFADMLVDLRHITGASKAEMAEAAGCDIRTYTKYEQGYSRPDCVDFAYMFGVLGMSGLRPVLDFLYPHAIGELTPGSSMEDQRRALKVFVEREAPDRAIRELNYLIFSKHGSNAAAQFNEFIMIDHLPMEYRVAIAELVYSLYQLAKGKGTLINSLDTMPDEETFLQGLKRGREAAYAGRQSYNNGVEL